MKSSEFDRAEGLLAHRQELQTDLQSIEEAEKRCAVVSGIHFSDNRCLLEQNYSPMN